MKAGVFELTENDLRAQMAWLRRLACSLVGSGPYADDAVQDTLVAALEHRPTLDRDVRPWLARVLANFIYRGHRSDRRRRNRETQVGGGDDGPPRAEDLLVRHEAARVVAGLVSALRDPHREIVLLRFAEGLSAAEIARSRGVPDGTVRRQLKEALDQLRGAVAAHYGREGRDWRLALIPLATDLREARPDASKGGVPMTIKSKLLLSFATAAMAVGLVLVLARGRIPAAEHASQATTGRPPARGQESSARPATPSLPSLTPARAAPGAGPPSFTTAAAAEPPGCRDELTRLRALADDHTPASPGVFERDRPSPRAQAEVAPFIERTIERLAGKAAYQLECRASICRFGVLVDPEITRQAPAWFEALAHDVNEHFHPRQVTSSGPETTKDALTGATLLRHWTYFNTTRAADEEHPFEGSGTGTTCGERVAALEKAIDEQREQIRQREKEQEDRLRQLAEQPANKELSRRVELAFRPITADATGKPAGAWDCRGASFCRWRGPAGLLPAFFKAQPVEKALSSQGLLLQWLTSGSKEHPHKQSGKETELELSLILGERSRADRGPAVP